MAKLLRIECPAVLAQRLSEALREYAEAAYPPGCSECGQVARAALEDAAGLLTSGIDNAQPYVELNKRIRAHLKAAVEYHCQQSENVIWQELLMQLLRGEAVQQSQIQAIEQKIS